MTKYTLKVEKRTIFGNKIKKLRREGVIPANVFGKELQSQAIQVPQVEFDRIYKESGETNVIWLQVEGEPKERPTLIAEIHRNPITGGKMHIDFHQVNLKEKVTAHVPVEITGTSDLVESGIAVLNQSINEIEIEALPTDIPESIVFDISSMKEIGDHLSISDAKVSSNVEIKLDSELPVVSLAEPQKEEVVPEEVPVEGEVVVEGEASKEEVVEEAPKTE